jgi:hypothetical protein
MDAILRFFLFVLLAAVFTAGRAQEPLTSLQAKAVDLCEPPTTCAHIGKLRMLGMLELPPITYNNLQLTGLSALAWDEDENLLYALSDHGVLFSLRPVFYNSQLTNVTLVHVATLIDPQTRKPVRWRRSDSEGLDIINGRNGKKGDTELLVSFEREPRIVRYRPDGSYLAEVPLPAILLEVKNYRGGNTMLESVCLHPREGILTVPEAPLENNTNTARLYRMDGGSWPFAASSGGVVAIECLPDGGVLLLERNYSTFPFHWIITLRRLNLPAETPTGTPLSVENIAVLDSKLGVHVDNFEGLTRHRGNHFFMVSDDNGVFVQRTLLMYFELLP